MDNCDAHYINIFKNILKKNFFFKWQIHRDSQDCYVME